MIQYNLKDLQASQWKPVEEAVLNFVIDGERILLIHKKRGLGAGLINGPGGRIDPGESPEVAAIREVKEELLIHTSNLQERGLLHFQFTDGYSLKVHVFASQSYIGEPQETEEAIPIWVNQGEIPYSKMWEDDKIWLPHMLNRQYFKGYFIFQEQKMLDYKVIMGRE